MAQERFERYEKKYRISLDQYQELMSRMITRLTPDRYGKYMISNVYLDTPDYRMIRRSLGKPAYKEKIRLRSYGVPEKGDPVFLELKKKYQGVVYKRRAEMTFEEARKYLYYGIRPERSGQILNEIEYACDFYEARPMVYVAYERIAFSGKEDPELRVTFDMNIRARSACPELDGGTWGTPLLGADELLMEVKIPGAMPLWMSRLFSQLQIYPTSYSKYGTYYQKCLAGKTGTLELESLEMEQENSIPENRDWRQKQDQEKVCA